MSTSNISNQVHELTFLEFFSGVGGWSFALQEAILSLNRDLKSTHGSEEISFSSRCLGAYDHSDLCSSIFRHNFPRPNADSTDCSSCTTDKIDNNNISTEKRPKKKKRTKVHLPQKPVAIEKLSKQYFEEMKAIVWMMSPPCQPHTRQHDNQTEDINDPRSKSFIHICDVIKSMEFHALPKIIMLENVIGFENSNSCKYWRRSLLSRQYSVSHFHLNPSQVGLPNDRPRYYCIAILQDQSNSTLGNLDTSTLKDFVSNKIDTEKDLNEVPSIHNDIEPLGVFKESDVNHEHQKQISSFLDPKGSIKIESILVPEKILSSNASWCFDIVRPCDRRSACFTHSYGKFIRGTGSVLFIGDEDIVHSTHDCSEKIETGKGAEQFALISPEERTFDSNWNGMELKNKLRYFTGKEIARLMGFPVNTTRNSIDVSKSQQSSYSFSFPADCTLKQQWKLMGNSLNVKVAGKVAVLALQLYLYKD